MTGTEVAKEKASFAVLLWVQSYIKTGVLISKTPLWQPTLKQKAKLQVSNGFQMRLYHGLMRHADSRPSEFHI